MSFGIKCAHSILDQHDFEVITTATDAATVQLLAPVREISSNDCPFKPGWCRNLRRGKKYGKKCIQPYKKDTTEMFNIGKEDQSKKKDQEECYLNW